MRIGNAAYKQKQHDVWGALLDSVYLHTRSRDSLDEREWTILSARSRRRSSTGASPTGGSGRSVASQSTSRPRRCSAGSRVTVARGSPNSATTPIAPNVGATSADEIRVDVLEHGVDERGVFVQHYETDALDASLLLLPLMRFLPPDDERIRATVLAIADELTEHGLVLRYRIEETDDGLHGKEGTFLICSFWLVSALCEIGEIDRGTRRCANGCWRLLARSACTPRRSTPAPVAISATSRRRSRTWR